MHALRNPQIQWIGTPVAHSKLTIAVQACFPGVRWMSAPGPSEFASLLRRVMLTTCALWDGHFGARSTGPYGPDGQSLNLAAGFARYLIGGVGKSNRVAAMLRGAILNPLRRRLSWSFVALMKLTGEPWHPGGETYLIGRESTVHPDINAELDLHRYGEIFDWPNRPQQYVDPIQGIGRHLRSLGIDVELHLKRTALAWLSGELPRNRRMASAELVRFCELNQIELQRRSVARRPRVTTVVDWWTDRIPANQVEEAIGRQDYVSQMEHTWRSKCSMSSTAGSTLPRPGRFEVNRTEVVAKGRAASGYRGERHT